MQMQTVKFNQPFHTSVSSKSQTAAPVQSCCASNRISVDTAILAVSIFAMAWARFISVRLHALISLIILERNPIRCVC